ncbi:MAG: DNA alkylation repair protein [Myxococcales bacterium]|nr:DNA alkylation repair protein [Myxococcales bacterium]
MSETSTALKDRLSPALVADIAARITAVDPRFDAPRFVAEAAAGLDALTLMARAEHVSQALERALPRDVVEALDTLVASMHPVSPSGQSFGDALFFYLPYSRFIARVGRGHYGPSMDAMHALTQRMSSEFCIRPFIEDNPDLALQYFTKWVSDPSLHVRRLVSEGTRPRLPWAGRLTVFAARPEPIYALLEALVDDPELYVRRSVANHLNDLSRSDPEGLLARCAAWLKARPSRHPVIAHALRSMVKAGHRGALALLGGTAAPAHRYRLDAALSTRALCIGDKLTVKVTLDGLEATDAVVNVDLVCFFIKKAGDAAPKVFRGARLSLAEAGPQRFQKTIHFAQFSTRTVYPGPHKIALRVDGTDREIGTVDVKP